MNKLDTTHAGPGDGLPGVEINFLVREKSNCPTCAKFEPNEMFCSHYRKTMSRGATGRMTCPSHVAHDGLVCPGCREKVTPKERLCGNCGLTFDRGTILVGLLKSVVAVVVVYFVLAGGGYFLCGFLEDTFIGDQARYLSEGTFKYYLYEILNAEELGMAVVAITMVLAVAVIMIKSGRRRTLLRLDEPKHEE